MMIENRQSPIITIGLPSYNGEKYILRAISSALEQTYKDFELIISDDNSSDKTCEIIARVKKRDQRIKLFKQKKKLGFRRNFNFVLDKARGEFFIWLAQDDFWDKNYLFKLVNLLQTEKHAVLAASGYSDVKDDLIYQFPLHHYPNQKSKFESLRQFIKNNDLSIYYGLFRRDVLKKIGGYQSSSRPFFKSSDYLTIFKVLCLGSVVYVPEFLFFKTDTGLHLERYQILKDLRINTDVLNKILRYLTFPISFLYDAISSIKILFCADFGLIEKIILFFEILLFLLKRFISFVSSLILGTFYFIYALFRKLILYRCINTSIHFMDKPCPTLLGDNYRALAFLNSFSQGKSGGDEVFIQIFKRLKYKKLIVVTSHLGEGLCVKSALKAEYIITTNEPQFKYVYLTYLRRIIFGIIDILKIQQIDLVYSSSDALPDVLPAFIYKILHVETKWIVKRYHNIPRSRVLPHFFQNFSLFFVRRADFVIQNGKFGFDQKLIENAKMSIIKYDAVFFGRIHASKGIFDLIDIWEKVIKDDPRVRLAVIGEGNHKIINDVQKLIEAKHMENNIVLLGFLSSTEAFGIIKSAKLFLFPSHEEAFGLVLGEAMLCRTPVVTYSLPSLNWCRSHVFAVPCFEKQYFAKLIAKLLGDDNKREKHVDKAYVFAKSFTWEGASQWEAELINRVL